MIAVDATCPLVTKVHNEAARHFEAGTQMIYIGHRSHPETVGTMGQLPPGEVLLVETVEDVATLQVRDQQNWPSSPRPPSRLTTPPKSPPP